jgi:hypothetical protein
VTAQAAFPGSGDAAGTVSTGTGVVEGVASEVVAVREFASDGMASGEASAADYVDGAGIVPEGEIDGRSAPDSGDDSGGENRAAQVDAVVIAEADAEARIPGFTPA